MASSPRIITQTDAVTRPGLEDKLISLFNVPTTMATMRSFVFIDSLPLLYPA